MGIFGNIFTQICSTNIIDQIDAIYYDSTLKKKEILQVENLNLY